ncbi:MAG: hypothetical protein LBI06_01085 [Treponema sp.]|jgi:hypothetical protein|nr:hypothetical protein [Treponema sp.]
MKAKLLFLIFAGFLVEYGRQIPRDNLFSHITELTLTADANIGLSDITEVVLFIHKPLVNFSTVRLDNSLLRDILLRDWIIGYSYSVPSGRKVEVRVNLSNLAGYR